MTPSVRLLAMAGSVLCLSAVVLAAMGAHLIDLNGNDDIWQTALLLHLFNAAALMGLVAVMAFQESAMLKRGGWLIVAGTVVFSGSIYFHVISGVKVPVITPLGGLMMMAGWAMAIVAFSRRS